MIFIAFLSIPDITKLPPSDFIAYYHYEFEIILTGPTATSSFHWNSTRGGSLNLNDGL